MVRRKLATMALGLAALVGCANPSTKLNVEPQEARAAYWFTPNGDSVQDLGYGPKRLNETVKLRRTETGGKVEYLAGAKIDLDKTQIYLSGATENNGIGIETKTKSDHGTFYVSADRSSDSWHWGAGFDIPYGESTLFGLGVDYVHSDADGGRIAPSLSVIQDLGKSTKFGLGQQIVLGSKIDYAASGFISREGRLGGRAFAKFSHNGNGGTNTFGSLIFGENISNAYSDFVVGTKAYNGDLFPLSTVPNLFGQAFPEYLDAWDRSNGGLVFSLDGSTSAAGSGNSSSLNGTVAYKFDGKTLTFTPLLSANTDFDGSDNVGVGFDTTFKLGKKSRLEAKVQALDLENPDDLQGILTYSIKF